MNSVFVPCLKEAAISPSTKDNDRQRGGFGSKGFGGKDQHSRSPFPPFPEAMATAPKLNQTFEFIQECSPCIPHAEPFLSWGLRNVLPFTFFSVLVVGKGV